MVSYSFCLRASGSFPQRQVCLIAERGSLDATAHDPSATTVLGATEENLDVARASTTNFHANADLARARGENAKATRASETFLERFLRNGKHAVGCHCPSSPPSNSPANPGGMTCYAYIPKIKLLRTCTPSLISHRVFFNLSSTARKRYLKT